MSRGAPLIVGLNEESLLYVRWTNDLVIDRNGDRIPPERWVREPEEATSGDDRSAFASGTALNLRVVVQGALEEYQLWPDGCEACNESVRIDGDTDAAYERDDHEEDCPRAIASNAATELDRLLAAGRSVGRLEEALREILSHDGHHATEQCVPLIIETARAALVRTGEEHGTSQKQNLEAPQAVPVAEAPGLSGVSE